MWTIGVAVGIGRDYGVICEGISKFERTWVPRVLNAVARIFRVPTVSFIKCEPISSSMLRSRSARCTGSEAVMSSLKPLEKSYFESLLGMGGGYVLEFTNRTFAEFFRDTVGIDVYSDKYQQYGDSKAKRLRAFWDSESDTLVGKVLAELLDYWAYHNPEPSAADCSQVDKCRTITARLLGKPVTAHSSVDQFLDRDLSGVSMRNVPIDSSLMPILESRFAEANRCMNSDAPHAAIFLSGSILEGLLLGTACTNPQRFNESAGSPKDLSGKVKQFHEWSLAQFIDVACEEGFLKLDVKKFSHALRDFRNYIHPYQQLSSRFTPDRHTANICLQVLRAAIASLCGQRP